MNQNNDSNNNPVQLPVPPASNNQENNEANQSQTSIPKGINWFLWCFNNKNYKSLPPGQKFKFISILAVCAVIIIIIISEPPSADKKVAISDDTYISCAKNAIAKELRSPSTARYYNAKVVEKDNYGRALVTMTVEAQNAFGGYVKKYYAVCIISYDPENNTFQHNRYAGVQSCDSDWMLNGICEAVKSASKWNEKLTVTTTSS